MGEAVVPYHIASCSLLLNCFERCAEALGLVALQVNLETGKRCARGHNDIALIVAISLFIQGMHLV